MSDAEENNNNENNSDKEQKPEEKREPEEDQDQEQETNEDREENDIKIKSQENISKYIHLLFEIGALPLSEQHNEILKAFRQKYSCLPSPIRRELNRDIKYLLLFS